MAKRKQDPWITALAAGKSITWTVPDGGDLASMRKAIKHGQTLTLSPIAEPSEIQVGDLVLVKWHQTDIFHIVGEIQGDQYLIVNSLGKVNGWVGAEAILGRITKIIEPEPRPSVPEMLEQLTVTYQTLIEASAPSADDEERLYTIVKDLHWYAARLGEELQYKMPRSNKWSFEQNLWSLTKQAKRANDSGDNCVLDCIDRGKRCVGLASEIITLFDGDNA
ncbi:MAG: hypothetical protein KDE19_10655 [Caldilineaceae bacterium]|nr:hypothetical protein [Caldilineaceae bacterium]